MVEVQQGSLSAFTQDGFSFLQGLSSQTDGVPNVSFQLPAVIQ